MCGIAGIIGRLDAANREALARMSAAMAHRGPDGQGVWESAPDAEGRGVLLAHRRLAILDVSSVAAQPMTDPVTGHVVVFNGEIYNYRELRARLASEGQTFASTGDTAVLLRSVALGGRDAVRSLRGMFAFAAWDPRRRALLLARDPLGIKPLYVARRASPGGGWSLAFASEVRALLASGLLGTPRLDPAAVASVAWNGFVVGPGTTVAGISLVPSGTTVEIDPSGREDARAFWGIPGAPAAAPMGEEAIAAALEEDVRLHLASDVPLAVFLSSGIDSSSVANLARRAARAPIHTFTLSFEEEAFDEGPVARRIAQAIGTDHRQVVLSEREFVAHLDDALDGLDQPTFDGLNSYYMSRAVRSAGFTVALVGTGGDELFGGYSSFRDLPALHRWSRRLRWVPPSLLASAASLARAALAPARGAIPPQTRWAKLPEMVKHGRDLLALYQLAYALFLPDFQRELLAPAAADSVEDGLSPEMRARLLDETRARAPLSALSVMELRMFLGERLLRDNDAASMGASIEQRVPLVDSALFEAVDRLGARERYEPRGRKALLRRIGLAGLPPDLFERPKRGFVLPFDRWIRRGLRGEIDGALRDPAAVAAAGLRPDAVRRLWDAFLAGAPGVYWSRVWAIYVLVRWCRRHGVAL